jgi:hypothetical protein
MCLICYVAGWRGTDWAAQIYRSAQVAHYGVIDWDPGWYGGTYPLNYSLVYPIAAAYLGLWPLAALSSAGAAFCFDRLVSAHLGRRPAGSWYFAVSTVIEVAIGQLPTLTGEALALGSVLCFAQLASTGGRRRSDRPDPAAPGANALAGGGGLGLGVLAALTTPVVGSFLSLALFTMAVTGFRRSARRAGWEIGAAASVMVSSAALPVLFPGAGYFPFPFGDLVAVLAISALVASPVLGTPPVLRVGALLYGAASVTLFVVPTQMGDNDVRLAAYIGMPLVVCYLPRMSLPRMSLPRMSLPRMSLPRMSLPRMSLPRMSLARRAVMAAATLVVAILVAWDWGPMAEALGGATDGRSSVATFYRPLIDELAALSRGTPVRVEVPPAAHHWESAYLAPKFSLARGWERQLDMAYDGIFYETGPLKASTYRAWLVANGVSYVALANAPLDYAATSEADLLRSGTVPGLRPVWRRAGWELWEVTGSPGLASGPARIAALSPRSVLVRFSSAGTSVVKLRWSRYWDLSGTGRRYACLMPAPGGWTELRTAYPGDIRLQLSVLGADHGDCKAVSKLNRDIPSGDNR